MRNILIISIVFSAFACQPRDGNPKENSIAYDFINDIIESNACPELDHAFLLINAGWDKQGFSPMYSSIMEKWFSKDDLKHLAEQQIKSKNIKLDSSLIKKKQIIQLDSALESKISYSHISYPLFNEAGDVCLFKAGYEVNGLAAGSAMYIFKKKNDVWTRVEMFGVSMS